MAFNRDSADHAADVAIVREFKETMHKLRMPQRKPSPGMREAFVELAAELARRGVDIPGALCEPELTDEEIAAQEQDAETFGHIRRRAWAGWFAWEASEMRAAARTGGLVGLYAFLSAPGRNWRPPEDSAVGRRADEPLAFELSETGRELLADEHGEAA